MPVQKVRAWNKQDTWTHLRTKRSGHARLVLSKIARAPLRQEPSSAPETCHLFRSDEFKQGTTSME